jgi:hypothetical protein
VALLRQLGAVPRRLIWDNESGIGRGKRHADGVGAFAGTLATTLQRLKPYDPEARGWSNAGMATFESSFMPGREFSSPADFNAQFAGWLTTANGRVVRTIKARPVDRLDADRAGMLASPRSHRRSAGSTESGWDATTTCASIPATTPSTRAPSAPEWT